MNVFSYENNSEWKQPPMRSKMIGIRLKHGERVRLETPGRGGYGAPGARAASSPEPTDPVQVEARRRNVADAISRLPGVDRAIWETQSTLLVYLLDDQFDPLPGICPELERYDELAASRLQLQPPAGSARPVRFVQCRAY